MNEIIKQQLAKLSTIERQNLVKQAEEAEMTIGEFVEFKFKAQIYENANERLKPVTAA